MNKVANEMYKREKYHVCTRVCIRCWNEISASIGSIKIATYKARTDKQSHLITPPPASTIPPSTEMLEGLNLPVTQFSGALMD